MHKPGRLFAKGLYCRIAFGTPLSATSQIRPLRFGLQRGQLTYQ